MNAPPAPAINAGSRVPLLEFSDLWFFRNDEPVFGPLSGTVHAGEALLVHGGNGAGKTSLLRVLAGLLQQEEGEIRFSGKPLHMALRSQSLAYLGHLPAQKADLTCLENLEASQGLMGIHPEREPPMALATVGLERFADQLARHLSAGQRKRLSLARVWLSPAPLWLLDEPYSNLDLDGIALVNTLVRAHLAEGGAALITTHGAYSAPPVRTRTLWLGGGPAA